MSNDLVVPGVAGAPSKRFDDRPIQQEKIGAGIGVGLGFSVISTDGKQFKLQHQGDAHVLLKEDGDPAQTFDVVILRGGENPSHTWYKQNYDKKHTAPPDCHSTDGVGPDDDSASPQAVLCQSCIHHEWKMQPNGRKGRACSDSLRLAVFPVSQNLIERATGRRIDNPILFRIPAASMRDLVEFMAQLKSRHPRLASYGYVTRIKFRQDVPHAQFQYQVSAWLTDEQIDDMEKMREEPVAYRILGQGPDGRSLVRAAANGDPQQLDARKIAHVFAKPPQAAPAPLLPPQQEIIPPPQLKPKPQPFDKSPIQAEELPAMTPVEDAPADMDALLAAMRPRPPAV